MDDVTSTSYEEQANWAGTLKKALCSVRDHPMRIYDARYLGSLKFIGPAIQEVGYSQLMASHSLNRISPLLSAAVCIQLLNQSLGQTSLQSPPAVAEVRWHPEQLRSDV